MPLANLNDQDLKHLLNGLAADEAQCKNTKMAPFPTSIGESTAMPTTFSEAAKRGLLAGLTMSQIIMAFIGGFATGGLQGGIMAVMALVFAIQPTPKPA